MENKKDDSQPSEGHTVLSGDESFAYTTQSSAEMTRDTGKSFPSQEDDLKTYERGTPTLEDVKATQGLVVERMLKAREKIMMKNNIRLGVNIMGGTAATFIGAYCINSQIGLVPEMSLSGMTAMVNSIKTAEVLEGLKGITEPAQKMVWYSTICLIANDCKRIFNNLANKYMGSYSGGTFDMNGHSVSVNQTVESLASLGIKIMDDAGKPVNHKNLTEQIEKKVSDIHNLKNHEKLDLACLVGDINLNDKERIMKAVVNSEQGKVGLDAESNAILTRLDSVAEFISATLLTVETKRGMMFFSADKFFETYSGYAMYGFSEKAQKVGAFVDRHAGIANSLNKRNPFNPFEKPTSDKLTAFKQKLSIEDAGGLLKDHNGISAHDEVTRKIKLEVYTAILHKDSGALSEFKDLVTTLTDDINKIENNQKSKLANWFNRVNGVRESLCMDDVTTYEKNSSTLRTTFQELGEVLSMSPEEKAKLTEQIQNSESPSFKNR